MKLSLYLFLLFIFFSSVISAQNFQPFKDVNGKWGLKSADGTIKVQPVYDGMYSYFIDGRLAVNKGFKNKVEGNKEIILNLGKWGFLDITGKEIIPLKYDRVTGFDKGLSKVMINDKWGYINTDGKFIIPANYVFIENFNDNNFAIFNIGGSAKVKYSFYQMDYEGGKWGVMDKTGKAFIPGEYNKVIWVEKYKYFWVKMNSGCGVLSSTGSVMITPQYDELFFRGSNLLIARIKNKYGAVSIKNDILVPIEYDQFPQQDFEKDFFSLKKGNDIIEFDLTGKHKPSVVSPEPFESNYQRELASANNSKERGLAINQYMEKLHTTSLTDEEKSYLLGEKFKQLVEIDYFGFFESVMKYKNVSNNAVIYKKAWEMLTPEQIRYIKIAAQYTVDEFSATQNNTTKPAWPSGLPKPGYGWGKTVSSDKVTAPVSTVIKPAVINPAPVDELTQLKDAMNSIKGRWVYLSRQKKHYYVPKDCSISSLTDQIYLKEIVAAFSYDTYKARNVFTVKYSSITYSLPVNELVKALTTNTNSYIVTRIYQCSGCLGRGGSWNNNTRLGATCTNCGGGGCVSSQDGVGYSNMPFADFFY